MIEEYGIQAIALSFSFLLVILFFAFELPYFQHILSLGILFAMVFVVSLILTWYMSWQASKQEDKKGQIVYLGMVFILVFMFLLSLSSFVNRQFPLGTSTKIPVKSITVEYSSMFGLLKKEAEEIEPTHLRISFDYSGKNYSRAFRTRKIVLEKDDQEQVHIQLQKGALNFTFVR